MIWWGGGMCWQHIYITSTVWTIIAAGQLSYFQVATPHLHNFWEKWLTIITIVLQKKCLDGHIPSGVAHMINMGGDLHKLLALAQ